MATVSVTRPDDLGPALREVRVREDITQSALAEMAGVGRQWLNAFESGEKASAPLDMIMRVISALGVSVALSRPGLAEPVDDDEPVDLDDFLDRFDSGAAPTSI